MTSSAQSRKLRDAIRHLVVSHGVLNENERPCGASLSVPHAYALLELLKATNGLTTTALATRLSIDRTNVSRLVTRMAVAGEVKRSTDSSDGRAKTVTLTARGRRIAEGVDQSSAGHFSKLAENLSMPIETVLNALDSLSRAMAEHSQEDA